MKTKLSLFIFKVFLILNPFYFFSSGLPQVSDYLMLFLILGNVRTVKLGYTECKSKGRSLLLFIIYLSTVNIIYTFFSDSLGRGNFLMPILFYGYNVMVFFLAVGLAYRNPKKWIESVQQGVILSLVVQVVAHFLVPNNFDEFGRNAFFFNVSNQAGYYAVLMIAILFLLQSKRPLKLSLLIMSSALASYIALLTVSKAAIAVIVLLTVPRVLRIKVRLSYIFTSLVVILAVPIALQNVPALNQKIVLLKSRVENGTKSESVSEWEYRGYDRISNHWDYLLFGAGEGGYNRFNTYIRNHEIHSSWGNILFSYGLFGFVLFLTFLRKVFIRINFRLIYYFLAISMYGFVHMGLRFTPFWIFLSLYASYNEKKGSTLMNRV